MKLSLEVKNYMSNYKEALEKELSYVKSKNWALEEDVFTRDKIHKRQKLITERNLVKLKHFAKITEDLRTFKTVQSFISILNEFMDIYIERFENCAILYDWTTYEETKSHLMEDEIDKLIDDEAGFQSEALDNVNKFRLEVKKLNLDNSLDSVDVPIYGDTPIPLIMRNHVEELYPMIKEYLNRDVEEEEEGK